MPRYCYTNPGLQHQNGTLQGAHQQVKKTSDNFIFIYVNVDFFKSSMLKISNTFVLYLFNISH